MTIKKAIKIPDWQIKQKTQGMEKLQKELVFSNDTHDMAKILLDVDKTLIANLESVRKELIPNCSHPKDMQDVDSNGNRYCMDCDWDL